MSKKMVIVLVIIVVIGIYVWQHKEINAQVVNAIVRTRGYQNNNPGNIKQDGQTWIGEVSPSTDPPFKQFKDMGWGYRAMFVNLRGYLRNGINTINNIVATWAPPSDNNDTYAYISAVSKDTEVDPDEIITLQNVDVLKSIAAAISKHENGVDAIPSQIDDGWVKFQNS